MKQKTADQKLKTMFTAPRIHRISLVYFIYYTLPINFHQPLIMKTQKILRFKMTKKNSLQDSLKTSTPGLPKPSWPTTELA